MRRRQHSTRGRGLNAKGVSGVSRCGMLSNLQKTTAGELFGSFFLEVLVAKCKSEKTEMSIQQSAGA